MKKFRKILLSQNNLAKALGFINIFAATKFNHHIEVIDKIDIKSALVLAPHPDDDVFGAGGTLSKLTDDGVKITVAYFCDGSGGVSDNYTKINKDLIEIRKTEAKKTSEILCYHEQAFFGYQDGRLASGTSAIRALKDLIYRTKPDIIFVPSFLDNHPDHRVVNEILINVLNSLTTTLKANLLIWAYEVWTPIYPNRIVNITENIEIKKKAIAVHKSQLKSRGYDKAIIALNQYRAEINNISGYAEAFFATTPEIYKKLYQKS